GGVRLHVVGFHVRRTAGQPEEDYGRVGTGTGGVLGVQAQRQQAAEADAAESERADLEETPPGQGTGTVQGGTVHARQTPGPEAGTKEGGRGETCCSLCDCGKSVHSGRAELRPPSTRSTGERWAKPRQSPHRRRKGRNASARP